MPNPGVDGLVRMAARAVRVLLGVCGVVSAVFGFSLAADTVMTLVRDGLTKRNPNEPSAVALLIVFAGISIGGAWLAWWGFRDRATTRPDEKRVAARATLVLLAESGPLTETQIVLRTGLGVGEVRAALERLRADSLVETVADDGVMSYRAVGVPRQPRSSEKPSRKEPARPTPGGLAEVVTWHGLTPSESNVLELVAAGLTNDQIAVSWGWSSSRRRL